ncbi:MAG TPA: hypothetical protein DEB39_02005 [Planctomycetaceae bacterium]|nr:hypothetical protein [Planctomycetaceae bacterium]
MRRKKDFLSGGPTGGKHPKQTPGTQYGTVTGAGVGGETGASKMPAIGKRTSEYPQKKADRFRDEINPP